MLLFTGLNAKCQDMGISVTFFLSSMPDLPWSHDHTHVTCLMGMLAYLYPIVGGDGGEVVEPPCAVHLTEYWPARRYATDYCFLVCLVTSAF